MDRYWMYFVASCSYSPGGEEIWEAMQDATMKTIVGLLLIALLVSTNGCVTHATVERAKGHQLYWSDAPDNTPHPAYYGFLPLTIPLDIATCPIQAIFWVATSSPTATNHDTPTNNH